MFELSLSITLSKQRYLSKIYKELSAEIKACGGVITKHNHSGRNYVVIAVPKDKKEYYKSKILDIIVAVIVNNYKYNLFKDYLGLEDKLLHQLFLNSLIIFDYDLDKEFIKNKIELKNEVCIDSFFFFKLQDLKSKWERTAYIIKQNNIALSDESIYEILKKLVQATENKILTCDVYVQKSTIKLKSKNFKKLFKNNQSEHLKLLVEILKNNPQKINVLISKECYNASGVIEILQGIFQDKIYL